MEEQKKKLKKLNNENDSLNKQILKLTENQSDMEKEIKNV